MIANCCTWFVNGSDQESFTYEGGKIAFHFSPHDNNLSKSLEMNLLFFADDEKHGLDILKRMFSFGVTCCKKYLVEEKANKGQHAGDFNHEKNRKIKIYQNYISLLNKGKIKLSKVPMNRFYIINWASNDNI